MPRRPSPSRVAKRGRRCGKLSRMERVEKAVYLLSQRIEKLEGKRRKIGFQSVNVEGDGIEQDDPDLDYTPDEVP